MISSPWHVTAEATPACQIAVMSHGAMAEVRGQLDGGYLCHSWTAGDQDLAGHACAPGGPEDGCKACRQFPLEGIASLEY